MTCFSRWLFPCVAVLVAGFATSVPGQVSDAHSEQISDAQFEAVLEAEKLQVRVNAAKSLGAYNRELLDEIGDFYHRGSEDEDVLRLFCREWVLAAYRDMFDLHRRAADDPIAQKFTNSDRLLIYLDKPDAEYFRSQLTEYLRDARSELLPHQRDRLRYLVENLLTTEDREAIGLLEDYAQDLDLAQDERDDAQKALARIEATRIAPPVAPQE